MSEWITKREIFFKLAIQEGLAGPEQLDTMLPLGCDIPQLRLNKWLRKIVCAPSHLLNGRRLVNRFKLGADPEFVFMYQGARVNASGLNLKQGQAFGSDNNGRLAEIRPYPSRSSLEVVASVLSTLRWMVVLKPKTAQFAWEAGAFIQDDGIGGHVHFGRKRPTREAEITALDNVEEVLLALRAYPIDDVIRRRRGDAHRQIYGALHDFRLQAHGYEYRTFPSWLDNPELAFMTITLAKLAVHNPSLCAGLRVGLEKSNLQKIKNLLAYYRNVDNDARLLLLMLNQRPMPRHIGGDFRARWGIPLVPVTEKDHALFVIPPAIRPDETAVRELTETFVSGKPLGWPGVMTPTWTPSRVPNGYMMCINDVVTDQAKGFGELIWDLCVPKAWPVHLRAGTRDLGGTGLNVSSGLARALQDNWRNIIKDGRVVHEGGNIISMGVKSREGPKARQTKDQLISGVFPIWRVKDVQPDSYEQWRVHARPEAKKDAVVRTKTLYSSGPVPNVRN